MVNRLTGLRVLDLGYIALKTATLNSLLEACANTLEELYLSWIMQADPTPLFMGYAGKPLQNVRVFASKGPQGFSIQHIIQVLGSAQSLRELHARNLTVTATSCWTTILDYLSEMRTASK